MLSTVVVVFLLSLSPPVEANAVLTATDPYVTEQHKLFRQGLRRDVMLCEDY